MKIEDLIGKAKTSEVVQQFLNLFNTPYKISRFPDSYFYIFSEPSIEIKFTTSHYLECLFFHNTGNLFTDKYPIEFPFGLSLLDTRQAVEEKIGPPERESINNKHFDFWTSHPELGVSFTYTTSDKNNFQTTIKHICFFEPETELSRLWFLNKTKIHNYLQITSKTYSPHLISDLLQVEPSRFAEAGGGDFSEDEYTSEEHFWELCLSENQFLHLKAQLKNTLQFLLEKESILKPLQACCKLKLKIMYYSLHANSSKGNFSLEFLETVSRLGIEVDLDIQT
ncbi:DUF4279 domain-containing protein [Rufibacter hautae]|uniref:DUF4279 domain-containing protein n=1 Tax=Rufibacter hautae TaxID=2595005 RepID=A0A5B6T9E1_9BACT|nr:DUF4279 domain-containing protein [Rufibacter hautae]KAA3436816.1 DUF4279 domain-containing protein [Rufibacter hautae]